MKCSTAFWVSASGRSSSFLFIFIYLSVINHIIGKFIGNNFRNNSLTPLSLHDVIQMYTVKINYTYLWKTIELHLKSWILNLVTFSSIIYTCTCFDNILLDKENNVLFLCLFDVQFENISLLWRRHRNGNGLQIVGLCSASTVLEQRGIIFVSHLLCTITIYKGLCR